MERESAVLHGAFLLSDKLSHPASLSLLPKSDWSRVGQPILKALEEIGGGSLSGGSSRWTKKLLTAVWLKVLCRENDGDVETSWRENPLFALQSGLPEVNHVVLMELVKSLSAADAFAQLLLCLPDGDVCVDLERMAQHVLQSPTSEQDVRFFLDVWWALWRGRSAQTDGGESIEEVFTSQFALLTHKPTGGTPQAAKRIRLDSSLPAAATLDVLHIFFQTLNNMKNDICSSDLCCSALSICLDVLYTSFLIKEAVLLPVKKKLSFLTAAVGEVENVSPQLIQELLCDLRTAHRPAEFQSKQVTLSEGLMIVLDLLHFWLQSGLLSASVPGYPAVKLQHSVQRLLEALEEPHDATGVDLEKFKDLLKSLRFPATESNTEVSVAVAISIISHRLDDYRSFARAFAAEESWADCEDRWIDCLEQNRAAFQQRDAVVSLVATLSARLRGAGVSQCKRMLKVVTDIFSALPLEEKNSTLTAVVGVCSRGFFREPVPSALSEAFDKELNMAFNCMIQGGGGAKATQGNLDTAVSLVARVAFQNPEAAVRSCCQAAVFNKGAFVLMAGILQKLPGLRRSRDSEGAGGGSLLCWCLRETIGARSMTAGEREQLVQFASLLMRPGEGGGEPLVSPQELVNTFVLPNISGSGDTSVDLELSLQLLHSALHPDVARPGWLLECCAFPLLYVLAQLQHQTLRCWERPPEGANSHWSMDSKELVGSLLSRLAELVGAEAEADPGSWSRALFWLHHKVEALDWTVGLLLKPVWREHFKNEVPATLLAVCDLPEQEWSGLEVPQYGPGTGLLAWMECCSLSDSLQSTMLSTLSLDQRQAGHLSMFSKGALVALTQVLPWCTVSQWSRLLGAVKELICSGRLHVPFSLEYVDFLPLLDLKSFSCELCMSVLLLRVFQLLCGSSCGGWLEADGWAHVGRLYALAVRDMTSSLRAKLPLPAPAVPSQTSAAGEERSQEVLFVLSQLFCHVQHVQVMMPGGQCEPLFLSSLEIVSHYEAVMAAFPASCSSLQSQNTQHFLSTITDNLENQEMKTVLQQKIAQLVSPTS
ncbi:gem-associated protein 4 [Neosynchiropus ocellatus]